jgi:hypothetical protein
MNITVEITKENKDGSADAIVRFDKKGLEVLVQWGMVALLTKGIDEYAIRPDEAEVSFQPSSKRASTKKATKKK